MVAVLVFWGTRIEQDPGIRSPQLARRVRGEHEHLLDLKWDDGASLGAVVAHIQEGDGLAEIQALADR